MLCSDWSIPEQIIAGNAQLSSGYVRILGSASSGEDELLRRHRPLLALLVDSPQGVGVNKLGILVQIINLQTQSCLHNLIIHFDYTRVSN